MTLTVMTPLPSATQRHSACGPSHDTVAGTPYPSCEPHVTQAMMTMQATPMTAMTMLLLRTCKDTYLMVMTTGVSGN